MTCIVGLIENGIIYMGGDSLGYKDNGDVRVCLNAKVFSIGDILIGYTSSFRMGELIRYKFKIPEQTGNDTFKYLVTDFVDALIDCFQTNRFATIENNSISGGQFLIGINGGLYKIFSDFHVAMPDTSFDACGCGEPFALGAMSALNHSSLSPVEKITKSLEIAEQFSSGVRKPFKIISSKFKE